MHIVRGLVRKNMTHLPGPPPHPLHKRMGQFLARNATLSRVALVGYSPDQMNRHVMCTRCSPNTSR